MGKENVKGEVEEVLIRSSSSSSFSLSSSSSSSANQQPLLSLNHVSFVCKSVNRSVRFYEEVLGFVLIKRPSSFDFQGAWVYDREMAVFWRSRSSYDGEFGSGHDEYFILREKYS